MYVRRVKTIITVSVVAASVLALIITNFFIPIIYFTAYLHIVPDINKSGQLRIRYIDVGFGSCTLVELPDGKTMLIDGGTGTYSNVYNILNALNKSKIDKIDYLFCTSVKSEHCGALAEIVKYKSVGTAYIPLVTNNYITDEYAAFGSALSNSGAQIKTAQFGEGAYGGDEGYFFITLSPEITELPECEYHSMNSLPTEENINAASVVLWLQYGGYGFMFLSDATPVVQLKLAELIKLQNGEFAVEGNSVKLAKCAFITAPNHCAEGYGGPDLYDVVRPESALIALGQNAKDCPSNTEIAALQLYVKNNIYRTDMHGTVTVTVANGNLFVSKEK